jgi:hypothetical protein
MNYSKLPVLMFLADNEQTNKLALCINYSTYVVKEDMPLAR